MGAKLVPRDATWSLRVRSEQLRAARGGVGCGRAEYWIIRAGVRVSVDRSACALGAQLNQIILGEVKSNQIILESGRGNQIMICLIKS